MGDDLDPFATAGDHRQHRSPRRHHPHIMLQLRHVFFGGRFLRERPRQHELGFEHRVAALDPAVEGCRHPAQRRMTDPFLDVSYGLTGIGLIPAPVQLFGRITKLDDEIARQILGLDLSALLPPEPEDGGFIVAYDDRGIGAADEIAAMAKSGPELFCGSVSALAYNRCANWGRNGISLHHGSPPWLGLGPPWCSSTSAARQLP